MNQLSYTTSRNWLNRAALRSRRSAFTLIELLTVIAIIAVLAAILFPVFAQAKESAKRAACSSNVKQISLAYVMYATDYDDTPPTASQFNLASGYIRYWWGELYNPGDPSTYWDFTKGLLQPYMKNVPIIDCPSAKGVTNTDSGQRGLAYGINVNASFSNTVGSMSAIERPAETILMADQRSGQRTNQVSPFVNCNQTHISLVDGRHAKKANVGWADGHAKAMSPSMGGSTFPGSATVYSAEELKARNWGWILYGAYQGGVGTANGPSPTDCYYYLAAKPAGT